MTQGGQEVSLSPDGTPGRPKRLAQRHRDPVPRDPPAGALESKNLAFKHDAGAATSSCATWGRFLNLSGPRPRLPTTGTNYFLSGLWEYIPGSREAWRPVLGARSPGKRPL